MVAIDVKGKRLLIYDIFNPRKTKPQSASYLRSWKDVSRMC